MRSEERFKWLTTPKTMRSQLTRFEKLLMGRARRRTSRKARSISHCETRSCVFREKSGQYCDMLPEQKCLKCGRRMILYRCSHNNCPTERRICVVCECGGIRPPIPFTQTSFYPQCHSDGMLLADENRSYS